MVCERLNIRQNGQLEPIKHNFGRKFIKQISGFAPYHRFNDICKTLLIATTVRQQLALELALDQQLWL
jgi:hypothetical protein